MFNNQQKIAIFYRVGQHKEGWDEKLFIPQMDLLKKTGLYDACDQIHFSIFTKDEKKFLPYLPDKTKSIIYIDESWKKRGKFDMHQYNIWKFANENPEYKIFQFHTHGVGWLDDPHQWDKKQKFNDLLHFCNIELWEKCVELLNWYDCVGATSLDRGTYWEHNGNLINLYGPHFPGDFYWANALYIKKLDPDFLKRDDLRIKYGIPELFMGSGNPRMFWFHHLPLNPYMVDVEFSKDELIEKVNKEIEYINDQERRPYFFDF